MASIKEEFDWGEFKKISKNISKKEASPESAAALSEKLEASLKLDVTVGSFSKSFKELEKETSRLINLLPESKIHNYLTRLPIIKIQLTKENQASVYAATGRKMEVFTALDMDGKLHQEIKAMTPPEVERFIIDYYKRKKETVQIEKKLLGIIHGALKKA